MSETRMERWMFNLFDYGMMLPLKLSYRSKSRLVRLVGLAVAPVWLFPAGLVCMVPLVLLMVGALVEEAWNGFDAL